MPILRIGSHAVTCGCITHLQVDTMLAAEPVNVLYSDPPWGDGNLKYWKTIKKRMDGVDAPQIDHEQLYARIGDLIRKYVRGHVFIETGLRWEGFVKERLATAGVKGLQSYRIQYQRGAESADNVLVMGATGNRKPARLNFKPYAEPELEARCIEAVAVPGGIVLDPCCGMGFSARAAILNGMRFRGNEFNQKRLDKTIAILNKG